MAMVVGGTVYVVLIVLVLWAGSRRIGSRWAYVIASGVASMAGALAIILTPSSESTGLEPSRPWSGPLLVSGGWIGGGLLLLAMAALAAAMVYRGPSEDIPEELDS
jgi:hypothetical protein